jgi:uncharacterized MAPEG superfamily protein
MMLSELMVLVAGLIPYATVSYAKKTKEFDNATPRNTKILSGARLRAYNAQLNGYEIFPFFAVAVIFAQLNHASQIWIDTLSVLFIVDRLIYTWAYITDKPSMRSALFSIGLLIAIALFFLPAVIVTQ